MSAEGLTLSLSLLFPWRTRTDCKILGERGKGKGGVKKKKNNNNNNNKLSGRTKHHVTRVESRLSRLGTWHRISTWGGCSKFDQKSFRCSA